MNGAVKANRLSHGPFAVMAFKNEMYHESTQNNRIDILLYSSTISENIINLPCRDNTNKENHMQ